MENSTVQEDTNSSTEEFLQWYTDMIENYPNTFVHYLSQDALLQWFGRSVKGPEKILYFIKTQMQGTKHILNLPKPVENDNTMMKKKTVKLCPCKARLDFPINLTNISVEDDFAGGDGPKIDHITPKRQTEIGQGDCAPNPKQNSFSTNIFETKGAIEFSQPYYKRGVSETKWERPCSLKIGYSGNLKCPVDLSIQLIIYVDNMTCKRNLLPEFEKCLNENNNF